MTFRTHPLEIAFFVLTVLCFLSSASMFYQCLTDWRRVRRESDRLIAQYMVGHNALNEAGRLVKHTAMMVGAIAFLVSEPPPPDPLPRQTLIGLFVFVFISVVMVTMSYLARRARTQLENLYNQQQAHQALVGGRRVTDGKGEAK